MRGLLLLPELRSPSRRDTPKITELSAGDHHRALSACPPPGSILKQPWLRANPSVARSIVQTAELACFDARCGDHAYEEAAFDHLFTPEHRYLLVTTVKVLRDIVGDQVADALGEFEDLDFRRAAPAVPDRSALQSDHATPTLAHEVRPTK